MIKGSFKERTGERYITNEGYEIEIIDCSHSSNCVIKFLYNNYIRYNVDFADIKRGEIKNPYHPSVYGVGYIGEGIYKAKENYKMTIPYKKWLGILKRSYGNTRYYEGVTVCEEWYNFQNFAKWHEENYNSEYMSKWALDKDILIKGNKIYSPETCCFVPIKINNMILSCKKSRGIYPIGVTKSKNKFIATVSKKRVGVFDTSKEAFEAYKIAKEQYIKEIADEFKNEINLRTYKAIYNWNIEITD